MNKCDYIFISIKYYHLSHHLKTKTVLAVKVVGRLYMFACLPFSLPSFLSLLLSLFLSSFWWVRYMNISLENCHLCCWLRTGINVDCINIRRLDFFFFFLYKKKKEKPAAASSQLKLYNDVVKTEFFVHYQNLLCYFQQHHGLGCHMSTMYWFNTCFSSVRGYVAKRLTSHFPFVSPSSNPQWVKKKKRKQERNWQHYTLVLTLWTLKLFSNRSGKNLYNDSVVCLIKFTFSWIKNQNIIIVVFCLPFKVKNLKDYKMQNINHIFKWCFKKIICNILK